VVILDRSDYIAKINVILDDISNFCKIVPVETKDNTATIEGKIQRRLSRTTERQRTFRVNIQYYSTLRIPKTQYSTLRIPKTQNVWPTQDLQKMYPFALYFQ